MTTVSDMSAAYKRALVTAARTAITDPAVLVCYGHPGTDIPDDVLSVGRVTVEQEPGPISATNRARDITLTAYVTASVYRGGGPEAEQAAGDRAYELVTLLEEYVRVTDTTLHAAAGLADGEPGLVWWCFCTGHDSDGATDPALLAKGRVIEVLASFTARARITN